jgi:hypothetical protein
MHSLIVAAALILTQADTFEQRWSPVAPLTQPERPAKVKEPETQERPKHHRVRAHRHHASGCKFGRKVYTHGKSWRCRR